MNQAKSLHHNLLSQAAAAVQQTQQSSLPHRQFPWFPQGHQTPPSTNPTFQIPDFIKHAAQQQLAQQAAQIKLRNEQLGPFGNSHHLPLPRIESNTKSRNRLSESQDIGETPNGKKRRGNYASYTPQQRIEIGAFSIEYGTGRASKQFGLPESTARGFRDKLIKMLQDSSDTLPLEHDRMQRLKTLIESGHDSNNAPAPAPSRHEVSQPLPAQLTWHKPSVFESKPLFQPQLDLKIKNEKSDESELNVTRSSAGEEQKTKLDEMNSDEDSGNSSANSSGNEEAKKHLQLGQMLGLENHPLYLMRNHFIHTLNAKKRAFDEDLNLQPERKVQRTMSTSSPQEPKNQDTRSDLSVHRATPSELARRREMMRSKHADEARRELLARDRTRPLGEGEIEAELNRLKALRAALYDQREAETRVAQTNAALSQADEKIDAVVTETHKDRSQIPMEGTVRMKGHVEVTAPPSDLSSIDGNEESEERNCHTPNSLSSEENKSKNTAELSHAEASEHLRLVEEALDKVVPGETSASTKNFTSRLIGTLTRTVKYVADCEKRLVEESAMRVKLESKVDNQEQLINALSHELMKFESNHASLRHQFETLSKSLEKNAKQPVNDITEDMTKLVKSLREPGTLAELKSTNTITLDVDLGGDDCAGDLAELVDKLGDRMTQQ